MTKPQARRTTRIWFPISAVGGPIGGGLIMIGHGSTLASMVVGCAPFALCALLYCLFGVTFLAATLRYACTGKSQRDFIAAATNAVVAILNRVPVDTPAEPGAPGSAHFKRSALPRQRAGPDRKTTPAGG